VPLGVTESFTFTGVPAGTYTFSVRALNAAGSSGSSNPVTLTFPTTCSGAPGTPINFVTSVAGNTATVTWMSAASGGAPTRYEVDVTGAFVGRLVTTTRLLSGVVGRGTYNVRVRAGNACGNSSFTAVQTLVVP
jgi:predicted phage tail protein